MATPRSSAAERRAVVGVVGLGAMGGAMGANLLATGFDVHGYDIEPSRLERLAAAGGAALGSPAEVAAAVDVLIVSLPSERAFEEVVVAPDGVAAGAHEDLIVVETSTLPIALKERGRAAVEPTGATMLDCPLSGTGDQAVHRDVVVLASGDAAAVERCRPVFDGFARATHHVGPFGAGSKMKFVANHLVAIHNVAAAEALSLSRAAGLEPWQTLDVISDGAGTSRMFEVRGPKMIKREYGPGIRTRVFEKDLALIAAFAAEHGAPVPLLARSAELYAELAVSGHADDDTASVYELFERRG